MKKKERILAVVALAIVGLIVWGKVAAKDVTPRYLEMRD